MRLVLEHIRKNFGQKTVLRDISFTFEEGKIYGLLGRNGAGKTTLFNCLSEEISADEGKAYLVSEGASPKELTPDDVGYVLSTPVLPEFLTGYEFIKFFMETNAAYAAGKSAEEWLAGINLDPEDWHRLIKGYSHGMKNKLQMLACFIASPPVMLLDEPLTSLDVVVALEVKKMLQAIKVDKILLFSTHILQLATDMCDEIVVLHDGTLELLDHDLIHSKDLEERLVNILSEEPREVNTNV